MSRLVRKFEGWLKGFVNFCLDAVRAKRLRAVWHRNIKKYTGKSVLTPSQKKEIKELYGKYSKVDFLFHDFYAQKTGAFNKYYLPEDFYYQEIDRYFNDWDAAKYLDNKCYYDEWYFKGINTPKTIVKRVNGLWSVKEDDAVRFVSKENAYELISAQDCFVKKAVSSCGGKGVYKVCRGTSLDEIDRIVRTIGSDIVVQEAIIQSDEMKRLNASSVNTIRILSFLDSEGNVKVYSAIVRMGINGAVVDNASSGGITCGIKPDGRLRSVAYATSGTRYEEHPSTGLKFSDVVIPNYSKIVSLAKELHKSFPNFRILSWDFAVDKNDEPLIVEVNLCYGGITSQQLNNGPIFGEDTEKILEEVFSKS